MTLRIGVSLRATRLESFNSPLWESGENPTAVVIDHNQRQGILRRLCECREIMEKRKIAKNCVGLFMKGGYSHRSRNISIDSS